MLRTCAALLASTCDTGWKSPNSTTLHIITTIKLITLAITSTRLTGNIKAANPVAKAAFKEVLAIVSTADLIDYIIITAITIIILIRNILYIES